MYRYLFFDLDGTLTQSEFGILNSVVYALDKMGIHEDDRESLRRFIGPPLVTAFMDYYGMSREDAEKATAFYREYYNAGELYNAPLYEGVTDMLETLMAQGKQMYIVTSKPPFFADRIEKHFGLDKYFKAVIGPELSDSHSSKADLVKRGIAMVREGEPGASLDEFVMIGDRFYDIDGAKGCEIDSVGVLYGYGSREELEKAGATYLAGKATDIAEILR